MLRRQFAVNLISLLRHIVNDVPCIIVIMYRVYTICTNWFVLFCVRLFGIIFIVLLTNCKKSVTITVK